MTRSSDTGIYPKRVHDYLKASAYTAPTKECKSGKPKPHAEGWAWEFIRRNAEYQKLSDQLAAERNNTKRCELIHEQMERFGPWLMHWKDVKIVERSGSPRNFAWDNPPLLCEVPAGVWPEVAEEIAARESLPDYALPVTICFDASKPLKFQWEAAKKDLERVHRRAKRRNLLPTLDKKKPLPDDVTGVRMLRILDAMATHPQPKRAAIMKALGMEAAVDGTAYKKAVKRAVSLRDGRAFYMLRNT